MKKNNQQMKKVIYTIAIVMFSFTTFGQESGSFLTIAGGAGGGGFQYIPKGINADGTNKDKFGWNAKLGYSYYFHPNWGLFTGVGISHYRTIGKYNTDFIKEEFYSLRKEIDDDFVAGAPTSFDLRVRLSNWEEEQKGYFIEVPLMLMFQYKLGETKKHGFYIGLGAKLQIPIISSTFRVLDGKNESDLRLNVSGKYDGDPTLELGGPGDPGIPGHGFGSIFNPGTALSWNGDLNLKMSVAGTAELGFLFGLHPRVDLMIGGYFDYGFNNIKKGDNAAFMDAPQQYHPEANGYVGRGISYNGMINSDRTDKVNLMAYGGRIGLQIKLGKLGDEPPPTLPAWMLDDEPDDDLEMLEKQLEEMRRLMQELLLLMDEEDEPEAEDLIVVQGNVLDSKTREPLDAIIELIDARTNKLVTIIRADENGKFRIPVTDYGRYKLEVHKEGYLYSSEEFAVVNNNDEPQVIEKLVLLDKLEKDVAIILKNIFFDTGKSTLKPESMAEISMVYKLMVENPTMEIEISGHTDNVGSAATNKTLSLNRATVVVKTLVGMGIDASRMTSAGYGFDKPIAPNTTADGRAQNRRTEFKVTKM